MKKPNLHSHTITHGLSIFNGVRECFAFAKPDKPTLKPKLGGSVCLSKRTKTTDKQADEKKHRTANSVYKK